MAAALAVDPAVREGHAQGGVVGQGLAGGGELAEGEEDGLGL